MATAMMTTSSPQTQLIARMERALVLLAYFIELDGDVHLPMYEKLEVELAELRAKEDVKARAGERLAAYRTSDPRIPFISGSLNADSADGMLRR
jgi:hypothetical protein